MKSLQIYFLPNVSSSTNTNDTNFPIIITPTTQISHVHWSVFSSYSSSELTSSSHRSWIVLTNSRTLCSLSLYQHVSCTSSPSSPLLEMWRATKTLLYLLWLKDHEKKTKILSKIQKQITATTVLREGNTLYLFHLNIHHFDIRALFS